MNLKVTPGITSRQIDDLIKYSNTDDLIKSTTHDSTRFQNKEAFEIWQQKQRIIYCLTDVKNKLFGIIWFGKENFPKNKQLITIIESEKYSFTFAIRIYDKARGKGHALPFVNEAFNKFKKTEEYLSSKNKGFWLETYQSNLPAVKTYSHFDFVKVSKPDNSGRILMIIPFNS